MVCCCNKPDRRCGYPGLSRVFRCAQFFAPLPVISKYSGIPSGIINRILNNDGEVPARVSNKNKTFGIIMSYERVAGGIVEIYSLYISHISHDCLLT